MQLHARAVTALVGAALLSAAPGVAQSAPGVVTSWTPFFGCWSTSSGGAIGPMVCVVPDTSRDRVEFMTVAGDSIVRRTVIDASGKRVAATRPGCTGWEQGAWTSDGQRLLLQAEYKCGKARLQRSEALLSLSHADAFTQVERVVSDPRAEPQVVNFIVQLDTVVFPTEVKRRLPHLRPLAVETAELETLPEITPAQLVEVASKMDPAVVQTWLEDRGQLTPDLATTTRLISAASRGNDLPQPFAALPRSATQNSLNRFGTVYVYSAALPVYRTTQLPLGWEELTMGNEAYWGFLAFQAWGNQSTWAPWPSPGTFNRGVAFRWP